MKYRMILNSNQRHFAIRCVYLFIFLISFELSFAQQYKLTKVSPVYVPSALKNIYSIQDIIQDHSGFIWIATQDGLYKFDGYKVTHYLFDPNEPEKLAGNWIQALAEDDAGNIWIGVFGIGLQKLDPLTEKFTLYK